jgi:hypothetical protein
MHRFTRFLRNYGFGLAMVALMALLPSGEAFAQAATIQQRACSAGGTLFTTISQIFTALLPVILALGGVILIFQRERAQAVIGTMIGHIADTGMTGMLIVGAGLLASAITTAIAGTACAAATT